MQTHKNPVPCFVCLKALGFCGRSQDNGYLANQPCDGIGFETSGHYGSTVYDPMHDYHRLQIAICDDCLKAGWARTREVTHVPHTYHEVLREGGEYLELVPLPDE